MKYICFGDLHIKPASQGSNQEMLSKIAAIMDTECADHDEVEVVITGDLYDCLSTPAMRAEAAQMIRTLASYGNVYIVKGNHDKQNDLDILALLDVEHYVMLIDHVHSIADAEHTVVFLPWRNQLEWDESSGNYESGEEAVYAGLRVTNPDRPLYIFGHAALRGCVYGNGQPALDGQLSPRELNAIPHLAGAVFGHVHKPQTFCDGKIGYTGSVINLNFGEDDLHKTYAVVVPGEPPVWKQYPVSRKVTESVVWSDEFVPPALNLKSGDALKLRVTIDSNAERKAIALRLEEFINSHWPGVTLTVEFVRSLEVSHADTSGVMKAQSLPECLTEYWTATGKVLTPSVRAKALAFAGEMENA